eukprot:6776974-Prorocentrum_lima.AAC.1
MQASINSVGYWATATAQTQLLTEAASARDAWTRTRLVLGDYEVAVHTWEDVAPPMRDHATR